MRTRFAWLVLALALGAGGFAAWSLSQGQTPPPPPSPDAAPPPAPPLPRLSFEAPAARPAAPGLDVAALNPLQKQMYLSAQRGGDWLFRANRQDGRFVYGHLPAVNCPMEGDHYLRQVGAAFALARSARLTGNERHMARARQAVLALLGDTAVDPAHPQVRSTALPSVVVNRLASAGLLVLAINELDAPQKDLLDQSEQLCNYIRRRQRPDGSLDYADGPPETRTPAPEDPEGINYYPGEALYGLMRSQRHRPAPWKTELARKAVAFYHPWWRQHKNMAFVPWQTAAYAEAYLLTKDKAFADCVFEMSDWVCGLQYDRLDPRHPLRVGGFMGYADGKPVEAPPQVSSAAYAEGLAEACRVAREAADLSRHRRYTEALERCLQFLTTLQYTEANTQHYAAWYRPQLVGGFHASDQDGNLRVDYTQHAVCAMAHYLTHVAR
jgi:hypothetical protein